MHTHATLERRALLALLAQLRMLTQRARSRSAHVGAALQWRMSPQRPCSVVSKLSSLVSELVERVAWQLSRGVRSEAVI